MIFTLIWKECVHANPSYLSYLEMSLSLDVEIQLLIAALLPFGVDLVKCLLSLEKASPT